MLTSQEIFYWVASGCLVILTVFLSISLVNLIRIMRQLNEAVERIHARLDQLSSIFGLLKSGLFSAGIKKVFSLFSTKETKKKTKKLK